MEARLSSKLPECEDAEQVNQSVGSQEAPEGYRKQPEEVGLLGIRGQKGLKDQGGWTQGHGEGRGPHPKVTGLPKAQTNIIYFLSCQGPAPLLPVGVHFLSFKPSANSEEFVKCVQSLVSCSSCALQKGLIWWETVPHPCNI